MRETTPEFGPIALLSKLVCIRAGAPNYALTHIRPDLEVALCLEEKSASERAGLRERLGRCNCRLSRERLGTKPAPALRLFRLGTTRRMRSEP